MIRRADGFLFWVLSEIILLTLWFVEFITLFRSVLFILMVLLDLSVLVIGVLVYLLFLMKII